MGAGRKARLDAGVTRNARARVVSLPSCTTSDYNRLSFTAAATDLDRRTSDLDSHEITRYLHEQIPITAAMEIEVAEFSGPSVRVTAPLAANLNHQQSAFGGSISTVGIVAGWAVLWGNFRIRSLPINLVIAHTETEMGRPACGDLVAVTRPLGDKAISELLLALEQFGKARTNVTADIFCQDQLVAKSTGTFVALAASDA